MGAVYLLQLIPCFARREVFTARTGSTSSHFKSYMSLSRGDFT